MNGESSTAATTRMWPRRVQLAGLWACAIAVAALIVAGPAYRSGILPLTPAFVTLAVALVLLVFGFVFTLVGTILRRRQEIAHRVLPSVIALVLSGSLLAYFGYRLMRAHDAPLINDITTDLEDPPDFADLVPLRARDGATNTPEYVTQVRRRAGTINVPEAQRGAYPDIEPARLELPPPQAFERAERAARGMSWNIVAVVPSEGRVEATDTSFYFGITDDIIIRVRADGMNSRVDMRSKARVGDHDGGRNAARVRAYLQKLNQSR